MISKYLKEYFKNKRISQTEIEEKTGISQSKINLSLNGKRKLSAEELLKLAIVFDIDLNKLKETMIKWFLPWLTNQIFCKNCQ